MMPSEIQRRAPFTTTPTCGTSTATSSRMERMNSLRAMRSQVFIEIWKASSAPTKPTPSAITWRSTKW